MQNGINKQVALAIMLAPGMKLPVSTRYSMPKQATQHMQAFICTLLLNTVNTAVLHYVY
jgi:hypothetical protein